MNEPRPRITHELKIWPEYFNQVRNGRMKFQLRRNDRDFKVGDELLLKDWQPPEPGETYFDDDFGFTDAEILVRVDYIMPVETVDALMGLSESPADPGFGYVIMSISLVN